MSDEKQIAIKKATGNFSMAMLSKVQGLSENSPLRKMQGQGALRLTVDGNQFQIKKGAKLVQTLKEGKKPVKELDIVIHMVSPVIQKQAMVAWDPKDPKFKPIGCWSNDGNNPDEDVWNKQSHSCDTCKFGKGEKAKDSLSGETASCNLTRLAVVSILSDNEPELMLMSFNWSSNSTKKAGEDPEENTYSMINYLSMLAGMEVETHKVITRLLVDDWSDPKNNCKLLFQPVGIVSDDHPNMVAHNKWEMDPSTDLEKMCMITQRKPAEDAATEDGDGGAPAKKKAAPKKPPAKKKAAAKKKPVVEEVEEDELEEFAEDEVEEVIEEVEAELVEEDEDDFDLDDLLDD